MFAVGNFTKLVTFPFSLNFQARFLPQPIEWLSESRLLQIPFQLSSIILSLRVAGGGVDACESLSLRELFKSICSQKCDESKAVCGKHVNEVA